MSFEAVAENVATMTETEKFDLLSLIVDSLKKTAEPFSKNSAKKYSEQISKNKNYRDLKFLFADKISTSDKEKSKSCVNKSIFFFLQSSSISLSLKSSFVTVSIESKSSLEKDSLVI